MYIYVLLCLCKKMARDPFSKDLENYRRRNGLTQTELASSLRVSQSHLSRLLSEGAQPGIKLRRRVSKLLRGSQAAGHDTEWSRAVTEMAARSPSFRKLVNAAMDILDQRSSHSDRGG
jgi:transcriptional regulator with XRE-family HTH domain